MVGELLNVATVAEPRATSSVISCHAVVCSAWERKGDSWRSYRLAGLTSHAALSL